MSPEQVAGEGNIGAGCDVYALGVILYELLTGRRPFEGPPGVMLAQILYTPAPSPRTHRADLDPKLEAICLKAMAKSPAERSCLDDRFGEGPDAVRARNRDRPPSTLDQAQEVESRRPGHERHPTPDAADAAARKTRTRSSSRLRHQPLCFSIVPLPRRADRSGDLPVLEGPPAVIEPEKAGRRGTQKARRERRQAGRNSACVHQLAAHEASADPARRLRDGLEDGPRPLSR